MPHKAVRLGRYGVTAVYLLAIHALLILAVFHPDFIDDQRWRASWLQIEPDRQVMATHKMLRAMAADQPSGRLLLIGDSQMQRMDASLLARPALNFGIGGDTIDFMSKRFGDYDYRARAGAVVLWGGVNDLLRGREPRDVVDALSDVRAQMHAGTMLYVVSISPTGKAGTVALAGRIAETNHLLERTCQGNCQFVSVTGRLASSAGSLIPAYDSGDGLHLNRRGHEQVAAALNAFLIRNGPEISIS